MKNFLIGKTYILNIMIQLKVWIILVVLLVNMKQLHTRNFLLVQLHELLVFVYHGKSMKNNVDI